MSKNKSGARIDEKLLERAVELYNRYRAPEAVARIRKVTGDRVEVVFEGSFCETCGIRDWVEDFAYVLEDLGVEARLEEYIEPEDDDTRRIGVFRIYRLTRRNMEEMTRDA